MKLLTKTKVLVLGIFAFALILVSPAQTQGFEIGNAFNLKAKASDNVEVESSSNSQADLFDDEDYDYKQDERLPKGIRRSPGIEKNVAENKNFPWGIWKKVFGDDDYDQGDDEDDENDDDNSSVTIEVNNPNIEVSDSDAQIYFETSVDTRGTLVYSTDSDLDSYESIDLDLKSNHIVNISGLEDNTTYYLKLNLETENGEGTYESNVRSFTTLKSDTEAPNIMFYHEFNVDSDSAYVIWITSEKTDSKLWVETDENIDTGVEPVLFKTDLSVFHVFKIPDLDADTDYYVKVSSSDELGNETFSDTISFKTDA